MIVPESDIRKIISFGSCKVDDCY